MPRSFISFAEIPPHFANCIYLILKMENVLEFCLQTKTALAKINKQRGSEFTVQFLSCDNGDNGLLLKICIKH